MPISTVQSRKGNNTRRMVRGTNGSPSRSNTSRARHTRQAPPQRAIWRPSAAVPIEKEIWSAERHVAGKRCGAGQKARHRRTVAQSGRSHAPTTELQPGGCFLDLPIARSCRQEKKFYWLLRSDDSWADSAGRRKPLRGSTLGIRRTTAWLLPQGWIRRRRANASGA
jgi:hypothetical protein